MAIALRYHRPARELLAEALPHWWRHDDDTSVLYHVLSFFAEELDKLAAIAEGIFADQSLETARFDPEAGHTALRDEWALLFGAEQEELPLTSATEPVKADDLRAYLQKRARENGTVRSLEEALYAFVPTIPRVAALTFPEGGSGIPFKTPEGQDQTFPSPPILVVDDVPARQISVIVADSVATTVDKPAFERAVNRHEPAHYRASTLEYLPPEI